VYLHFKLENGCTTAAQRLTCAPSAALAPLVYQHSGYSLDLRHNAGNVGAGEGRRSEPSVTLPRVAVLREDACDVAGVDGVTDHFSSAECAWAQVQHSL
jgi:hypothetical protein